MNALIEKYQNMRVEAKAAIWFIACSFLQKGISFVTVPIFTRMMSTVQYGTYSVYLSWLQVLTILCTLNLYYGTLDNGMSKFAAERDRFISSMQGLCTVLTLLFFVLYLIMPGVWGDMLGLSPVFIVLMFIEVWVSPALAFWSGRQRFEYKYKRLVIVTLVRSLLNPVLGIILVQIFTEKDVGRVLAIVIVELCISGVIMLLQFVKGKTFFHRAYWRYGLTLAVPMLPHYLAGTVLSQGDRIMIEKMVGKSEVAFYSVAYSVGMIANIFTNAINSAITPMLYGKMKQKDLTGVPVLFNGLLLIVFGIALGMMIISPELVLIFGSEEYMMGQYVIPPVAASVFFIFLYGILSLPQFFYEKTKFLMISSMIAAGVNVLLNYLFIRAFGFVAAGYTTLVCYVLYSWGHYLISNKILKKELPNQDFIDKKFVALLSFLVIAVSVGINFVFPYRWVRFLIALIIMMAAVFKRDQLMSYVRLLRK